MDDRDLIRLLDLLKDQIENAKGTAFNQENCIINREETLDILGEIREKLPAEIAHAKQLVEKCDDYIQKTKDEATRIINNAEVQAEQRKQRAEQVANDIISDSKIIVAARKKAGEITHRAEERSKELYKVTNAYTDDALRRIEEAIGEALDEVRQARTNFRKTSQEKMLEQQELQDKRESDEDIY